MTMILTDKHGRLFDKPESAAYRTSTEFLRPRARWSDQIADAANSAFAEGFHKPTNKTKPLEAIRRQLARGEDLSGQIVQSRIDAAREAGADEFEILSAVGIEATQ